MGVSLVVIWAVTLAVLWPTLGTNNRGLPPTAAIVVNAVGFLFLYLRCGVAPVFVYRFLTSRRPSKTT